MQPNPPNPIETWLTAVAYSHSQSKGTAYHYKKAMEDYCKFIQTTPNEILTEYETTDEKIFKRKHSQQIQQWIAELYSQKMAIGTIKTKIGAIKSFYKYKDLSLGYIPQAQETITYHNRDIQTKEIAQIIALSPVREKAFYAVMAQSGLRPCVMQQLQLKQIENIDIEQKSYKIDVPKNQEKGHAEAHPSFIGEDARKYLKQYLTTRTNLTPNNLVFCAYGKPNTPINIKNVSRSFQTTAQKLRKTGTINYEIRKGKPSELRLYTLRKFFKRKSKDMGDEDTNYLMGHIIVGSNGNYKPQDPEYYRKRYEDKALPFLRLEAPTPSDTDEIITTLKEQHRKEIENLEARLKEQHQKEMEQRDKQIEELQAAVQRIQETTEFLNTLDPQHIAEIVQEANIHKKSLADLRIGEPIEIPFSVMKELLKQAQTEGKDQIEINPNRLKKMMDEENKKVRKTPKSRDK